MAHGGRRLFAQRMFPGAPEPFLDLSTGINPHAYPLPTLPPETLTRLPEPEEVGALERAAAGAYGVADPAMVVAAPGTQALIQLLPRLFPLRTVAVLGPTYAEHARVWQAAGARVVAARSLADLRSAPGAVLCNPNNPDGRRWPGAEILAGAPSDLLVIDEAFVDLEEHAAELSCAPLLPHRHAVVLRSFGKTYGLAGVRLGFALAAPPLAAMIREALGPWAVSGIAIAAGRAALADSGWRAAMATRLRPEAESLDACLAAAALTVRGGTVLFRLAEGEGAQALFNHFGRAGILVRRFAEQPNWLRFGLPGTPEAWRRVRAALAASPVAPGAASDR